MASHEMHVSTALAVVEAEGSGIVALRNALTGALGKPFAECVELIKFTSGRVIVSGLGKSGQIGRKIAATLASTGTPAYFVHAAEANHGDLGMIQQSDIVLAISWSGESSELGPLITYTERFSIPLIAMTSRPDSMLGSRSAICLTLPAVVEACPNLLAPTTSTTMQLVLGDALAVALLNSRGFSANDFAVFHPGGNLGAQLKPVSAFMRRLDEIPTVGPDALVGDALIQMSHFGLGYTLVLSPGNELAGIVTDGDFRRGMRPDLVSCPVQDIMTRTPKVLDASMFAAEALSILQRSGGITAMPVMDNGRAVGGVHIIDFVRAGII